MRYIAYSLALLGLACVFQSVPAVCNAAYAETAEQAQAQEQDKHVARESFARHFATMVLAIIQDPKKSYGDRKTVLRDAFRNSVDIDWIAHFVLGKNWNLATNEQRQRYIELYRAYLTESYVSNFAENPDKRISDIHILNVNDGDDNKFTVKTGMRLADGENLNVGYLVSDNGDSYKVLDIIIENVSLITTHRAEFTQLADARGIEGVIARLEEINSQRNTVSLTMK